MAKLLNEPRVSENELRRDYGAGIKISEIAKREGVSRRTVERWNEYWGLEVAYKRVGICMVCGKEFEYWRSRSRVYCSRGCYDEVLGKGSGSHWGVTRDHDAGKGITRRTYLNRAWRVFKEKQPYIEKKRGWVMHHLDGDITNNEAGNLFIFYGHGAHMKHHHLVRKGVVVELRDIIDGVYVK